MTGGAISVILVGPRSIVATATEATGGTAPYAHLWQVNWPRGGAGWVNCTGAGVTTLAATIQGLGPAAAYQLRVQYTDAGSNVAYSPAVAVATRGVGWWPGAARRRG